MNKEIEKVLYTSERESQRSYTLKLEKLKLTLWEDFKVIKTDVLETIYLPLNYEWINREKDLYFWEITWYDSIIKSYLWTNEKIKEFRSNNLKVSFPSNYFKELQDKLEEITLKQYNLSKWL